MDFLNDKKTYYCAAAGAVVTALYILGVIDQPTWEKLMGLIVSGAAAALKHGQNTQTAKIMAQATQNKDATCPPRV